tara:strand:+ start:203 stop:622 length:420 start_codon:yes stop_codon:yes gene_type:complete
MPTGFSVLFTTTEIAPTLGQIVHLAGTIITHEYSGGVTSFVWRSNTLTYNGEITSGQVNTVAIIYDTTLSTLRLLVDGVLVDTVPETTGAFLGTPTALVGHKAWNVSDFRVFNTALSDGAVNYYHLDAASTGLAVGRLG